MEKLRFKDNYDHYIIADIKSFHATLMSSSFIINTNDIFLKSILEISSLILAGDFTDDGSYLYEVQSKYLTKRAIKYADVHFTSLVNFDTLVQDFDGTDYTWYIMTLIKNLEYMLDYSYGAVPRRVRTARKSRKKSSVYKKSLNKTFGYLDTDGVFDDYPSFIGSFAQPNPIPCDGDVE